MKKKVSLFYICMILIFITLLVILVFSLVSNKQKSSLGIDKNICLQDSDCVKVQTSCCSCNAGGEEKCVLKSEQKQYEDYLKNCSSRILCAQIFNCKINSCQCIKGSCNGI